MKHAATYKRYALTMDYGDELRDAKTHLRALLKEGNEDSPDQDDLGAFATRLVERDAAIARCALVLAHRKIKDRHVGPDEEFWLIESALEWLFRA